MKDKKEVRERDLYILSFVLATIIFILPGIYIGLVNMRESHPTTYSLRLPNGTWLNVTHAEMVSIECCNGSLGFICTDTLMTLKQIHAPSLHARALKDGHIIKTARIKARGYIALTKSLHLNSTYTFAGLLSAHPAHIVRKRSLKLYNMTKCVNLMCLT